VGSTSTLSSPSTASLPAWRISAARSRGANGARSPSSVRVPTSPPSFMAGRQAREGGAVIPRAPSGAAGIDRRVDGRARQDPVSIPLYESGQLRPAAPSSAASTSATPSLNPSIRIRAIPAWRSSLEWLRWPQVSQSLPTNQAIPTASRPISSGRSSPGGRNPSIRIRAIPTSLGEGCGSNPALNVAIPPSESGRFRRCRRVGYAARDLHRVSIPPYESGQFRLKQMIDEVAKGVRQSSQSLLINQGNADSLQASAYITIANELPAPRPGLGKAIPPE